MKLEGTEQEDIVFRVMMKAVSLVALCGLVLLSVRAGADESAEITDEDAELKAWIEDADAIANDSNITTTWFDVVRGQEAGQLPSYYLRSYGRAFQVYCPDRLILKQMAEQLGFDAGFVDDVRPFESGNYNKDVATIQPKSILNCNGAQTTLWFIAKQFPSETVTEYYLNFVERPGEEPEFFRIGCQGILEAIGKDMLEAENLEPYLRVGWSKVHDDPIACKKGVRPNAQLLELSAAPRVQRVEPGSAPESVALQVMGPRTYDLRFKHDVTGECRDALKFDLRDGQLTFEKVPDSTKSMMCDVSVIAYATNLVSNEARFTITINEAKPPRISWVSPADSPVKARPHYYSGDDWSIWDRTVKPVRMSASVSNAPNGVKTKTRMSLKSTSCPWITVRKEDVLDNIRTTRDVSNSLEWWNILQDTEILYDPFYDGYVLTGKAPTPWPSGLEECMVVIEALAVNADTGVPIAHVPALEHPMTIDVSALVAWTPVVPQDSGQIEFKDFCDYISSNGAFGLLPNLTVQPPNGEPIMPVTRGWTYCNPPKIRWDNVPSRLPSEPWPQPSEPWPRVPRDDFPVDVDPGGAEQPIIIIPSSEGSNLQPGIVAISPVPGLAVPLSAPASQKLQESRTWSLDK